MTIDPRRIADSKDAWVTALYAKTQGSTDNDAVVPLIVDANGYLLVNQTIGTVVLTDTRVSIDNTVPITVTGTVTTSAQGTATTISNAVSNPVNVSLTSTLVTVGGGAYPVVQDTGNSTTATLGTSGVFTGAAFDMTNYASWSVDIYSTTASATNGISVQWSNDATNWDFSDAQTYVASVGNMITFGHKARYVRLVYTNTNSAQSVFRVNAFAQPIAVRQTRKFIGNALTDQDTAQVVVSALQGHTTAGGGAWIDVKVNPSGELAVTNTPSTTAATITNAVGNPVNVSLTNTQVSVSNEAGVFNVNVRSATLGTVVTSMSSTVVTVEHTGAAFNVNIATATLGTVTTSLASTVVSVSNQVGTPIFVTNTTTAVTVTNAVGTPVNVALTATAVTASLAATGVTISIGRTPTGSSGSISATFSTIITPTNRAKIYAFSFTTTSASEVTVLLCDGVYGNAKEFWRATLMTSAGGISGANLAVSPPGYLFATRSTSAVTISLSTAVLVHYSLAFYDEA